jgi:hypothetical protein
VEEHAAVHRQTGPGRVLELGALNIGAATIRAWFAVALVGVAAAAASAFEQGQGLPEPEARAVAYLSEEVPRWRREHPCYSCHNNGDATRALLAARRAGHEVGGAIEDTVAWLSAPERWDQNARRGGSEELPLARIQFAAALIAMPVVDGVRQDAVDRAAALVIAHQQSDGAWQLNASQLMGGPTSYGVVLATAFARNIIANASGSAVRAARERADRYLVSVDIQTVLDASSALLGLVLDATEGAAQRTRALGLLRRGQGTDGGWGPFTSSRSEPFDTALAVLALSRVEVSAAGAGTGAPVVDNVYPSAERRAAIERGRHYLASMQQQDGSWVETTRPAGLESYAQRISTTAWCLQALLESRSAIAP